MDDWSQFEEDRYQAGELTFKQLQYQTQDHPSDCECAFCESKRRKDPDQKAVY